MTSSSYESRGESFTGDRAEDGQWLDFLGSVARTDKSSIGHGYLEAYSLFLAPFQMLPITLIEIGVQDGYSLDLWSRYFPLATIVGIDCLSECSRFERGRVKVRVGSQNDEAFLEKVVSEFRPDIVIDDGSHQAHDIFVSLRTLFPALSPGGLYVVEDLNFHRSERAAFNIGLSDLGNPIAAGEHALHQILSGPPFDVNGNEGFLVPVDDIQFVAGVSKALIIGKKPRSGLSRYLARTMEDEARSVGTPAAWLGLANFLDRHGGTSSAVIRAFEHAAGHTETDWQVFYEYSRYLMFLNKTDDAFAVAQRGCQRSPGAALLCRQCGELALRKNDLATAERNLKHASRLSPDDPWTHFHLSDLYHRQERYHDAIQATERAVAAARDDVPEIFRERLILLRASLREERPEVTNSPSGTHKRTE